MTLNSDENSDVHVILLKYYYYFQFLFNQPVSLQITPGWARSSKLLQQNFRGEMPFLLPNQQCQSTEGLLKITQLMYIVLVQNRSHCMTLQWYEIMHLKSCNVLYIAHCIIVKLVFGTQNYFGTLFSR